MALRGLAVTLNDSPMMSRGCLEAALRLRSGLWPEAGLELKGMGVALRFGRRSCNLTPAGTSGCKVV